jgi:hypothetical protein
MIGHERTDLAVPGGGPPVTDVDVTARDHRPVDGPDGSDPALGRRSFATRVWRAPLLAHVLLLVVVLVGVVAATDQPDSFTTDEGSYEIQLRALDQGSWVWDAGTADLDPDGTHYPVAYSTEVEDGFVPLAKHPLWPWAAARASTAVGVDHAYDLLGSLAVVVTAVAAWYLAAARDPHLRRGAFWLAALAPVTVTATFGWAHAAAAAAGGLAVLGAVRLAERDRPPGAAGAVVPALLVAGGVALGILVRTEGVLFAIALAGALAVGGWRAGRSWRWSIAAGAAVGAFGALVIKVEDLWIRSIIGSGTTSLTAREGGGLEASGFLDARIKGAARSLFDVEGGGVTFVVVVALLVTAIAAAYVVRGERRWVPRWHVAMLVLVLAFVFRVQAMTDLAIRGIVVAWPILLVGLVAAGAQLWRKLALETTVVVLFAGAILATQYPDGGAIQWGGRFFAPLVVPLSLAAAVGLQRLFQADDAARPASAEDGGLPIARMLVGALVVLPLVLGTWLCATNRSFTTSTYTQVDAQIRGLAVTPDVQIPRLMWRYDAPWLVVDELDEGADLAELLSSLHARADGPDEVTVVMNGYDVAHAGHVLDSQDDWDVVDRREINGLTVVHLER